MTEDYDALVARLAEAERLIDGWLTYGIGPSDDSPLVKRSEEWMEKSAADREPDVTAG